MILLNPRYYGLVARCNACGALLGYKPDDVDKDKHIKCPQCDFTILVPFDPNYDGIVKEEEKNNT